MCDVVGGRDDSCDLLCLDLGRQRCCARLCLQRPPLSRPRSRPRPWPTRPGCESRSLYAMAGSYVSATSPGSPSARTSSCPISGSLTSSGRRPPRARDARTCCAPTRRSAARRPARECGLRRLVARPGRRPAHRERGRQGGPRSVGGRGLRMRHLPARRGASARDMQRRGLPRLEPGERLSASGAARRLGRRRADGRSTRRPLLRRAVAGSRSR